MPRTLNPVRLGNFLSDHLEASHRIAEIASERQARLVYSISEATFCGALAARRLSVPSLVHVIGMSIQSPRWAARIYIPLLSRLTDEFVACSSAVADMLADHGVPDGHFEFRSRLLPSRWKCEAECHADNGPKTGKPAESLKHVHLVIRIGGLAKNRSAAPKGVSLSRPVARHEPLPASWNDPAATGTNSQS